jgi:diacylglycerol kinase (ATP)
MLFLKKRLASFAHAFRGLWQIVRHQANMQLHLVAAVVVLGLAAYLRVEWFEWSLLVLAIGLVVTAEALNTALETLGNAFTRESHPLVGQAKDMAAAGVLLAAITAACIGACVFVPHLGRW